MTTEVPTTTAQHLGYFAIGMALFTQRRATKGQNCTEIFVLVDKIRCICTKFAEGWHICSCSFDRVAQKMVLQTRLGLGNQAR